MNVFSHPRRGKVAAPQPSAERFRGLSVGSIRNPNRRRSIASKYALDARAVSRLSFELWTSKPRIPTSSTCSSGSTARRTWRATTFYRSGRRCSPNRRWCDAGAGSAAPGEHESTFMLPRRSRRWHSTYGSNASGAVVTDCAPDCRRWPEADRRQKATEKRKADVPRMDRLRQHAILSGSARYARR